MAFHRQLKNTQLRNGWTEELSIALAFLGSFVFVLLQAGFSKPPVSSYKSPRTAHKPTLDVMRPNVQRPYLVGHRVQDRRVQDRCVQVRDGRVHAPRSSRRSQSEAPDSLKQVDLGPSDDGFSGKDRPSLLRRCQQRVNVQDCQPKGQNPRSHGVALCLLVLHNRGPPPFLSIPEITDANAGDLSVRSTHL